MKNNHHDIFRDDLWSLTSYNSEGPDSFTAVVKFNTRHRIFDAHFPESPVVPGACILQITTELMSHHLSLPVIMKEARNIKFTSIINPLHYNEVVFSFRVSDAEAGNKDASVTVSSGTTVFVKISAQFSKA